MDTKNRDKLTQKQISTPLKVQISNDKWSEEVQNNIKGVEKNFRQNPRMNIIQSKRQKKNPESTTISKYQNTKYI